MADNIPVTPGSGVSIGADDIGGVMHQRVKLSVGTDGAATDMKEPVDGQTTGALPSGALVWDNVSAAWNRSRTVRQGDGTSGDSVPEVGVGLFNGSTFDRQRGNTEGALLASAARTVATNTATLTNYNARGVLLSLLVTATGTGTLTIVLNDAQSFLQITASPTVTASHPMLCYPGVLDTDHSGTGRSVALPRSWYVTIDKSDASSWTYSLVYSLIV